MFEQKRIDNEIWKDAGVSRRNGMSFLPCTKTKYRIWAIRAATEANIILLVLLFVQLSKSLNLKSATAFMTKQPVLRDSL